MKLLIIFLNFLAFSKAQTCGKFTFKSGLVVGGDTTARGEFPFLVALLKLRTQKFFCGATLITQKNALTGKNIQNFIIIYNFINSF